MTKYTRFLLQWKRFHMEASHITQRQAMFCFVLVSLIDAMKWIGSIWIAAQAAGGLLK